MSSASSGDDRFPGTERIEEYRLVRELPTRWADNDQYGHLNNIIYYSFVDTLINVHLIENAALDLDGSPEIGYVVESGCRYRRSVAYPDPVLVGISVVRVGRSSVVYRAGIASMDGEVAAEVHFVHVYVQRDTGLPTPVPDRVLRAVEPLRLDLPS